MGKPEKLITFGGQTHTAREWSEITGLSRKVVHDRNRTGKPLVCMCVKNQFEVEDFHFPNIEDSIMREMEIAITQRAVEDWRYLCRGGIETKDRNFAELTEFFRHELPRFINSDETAARIWTKMQRERREAISA